MFTRLTTRFITWSLLVSGSVYVITIGLSNRAGRRAALAAAEREASNATDAAGLEVEGALRTVEESVDALARAVSELHPDGDALERLLRRFAADQGEMVLKYDVILSPAAGAVAPPWYRETMDRGSAGWTEPYLAPEGAKGVVMTRTAPVRTEDGKVAGVAAATLRLDFLSAALRKVHLGASGVALALSRKGFIIGHSRDPVESLLDPVAALAPALRAQVEPIVSRAEAGQGGFVAVQLGDRVFRITVRPIPQTGGVLGTLYAEDELLAEVSALRRTQIVLAATGLSVLALAVVLLSRRITRPLGALAASAGRLATGDLDAPLPPVASRDEVGELTDAFRNMRDSLKVYVRNLQDTTATKERLEGELRAARLIQADMLPPPMAGGMSAGFELSATLAPARVVGGDLFDHFMLGRLVFFLVADVSGKGVAAALFMARTKTLFDAIAATEHDPGVVLERLNRSLCTHNQAGMFVTAVCGVLDIEQRTVRFAMAGHEPPLLVRPDGPPGPLAAEGGRVLGWNEAGTYPVSTVPLRPRDAIVMYTDGVSEAQNAAGDFFGVERVLAATARDASGDALAITSGLLQDIKAFAGAAPQSDDVTILTLRLV